VFDNKIKMDFMDNNEEKETKWKGYKKWVGLCIRENSKLDTYCWTLFETRSFWVFTNYNIYPLIQISLNFDISNK
jgi:hypothetical protein